MPRLTELERQQIDHINALNDKLNDLENQIDRLADYIMDNIPGEPSQNEGAIECAIRLLKKAYGEKNDTIYG